MNNDSPKTILHTEIFDEECVYEFVPKMRTIVSPELSMDLQEVILEKGLSEIQKLFHEFKMDDEEQRILVLERIVDECLLGRTFKDCIRGVKAAEFLARSGVSR